MAANEWYKKWFNSPYYHKLYFEGKEKDAEVFIQKLVNHLKPGPGSRVLDTACGRGRFSRLLASFDLDVTSTDISMDTINYASQFSGNNVHFYFHDMRLPFWVNYFDYAFNFFSSFGYFNTSREHDDVMRTISYSLKPGGTVVFDYLNTHYAEDHLEHNETKKVGETNYELYRWHDDLHFYKKIIITDSLSKQPEEHTEKRMKFSLGDFTDMLSFQKMQVTEVFGDYLLNPYHIQTTPRMIIVARKMA